jgi:hypothetical protein
MVDVLGVHGIGQQQSGGYQQQPSWQAALNDGITRARGRTWPKPELDLVFYGDLFLPDDEAKSGIISADLVPDPDADPDLVSFFAEVQDEVVRDVEPLEPAAEESKGLPRSASRLAAWLERRFGIAGKLLFAGDLVQVRRYQRDEALASDVLGRVRELLDVGPRVMIGHSLGSIVAYEALCLIPDHTVHTLVTLGSPMGLRSIRGALHPGPLGRLPQLPPGVRRWVNVYDKGDPVSLAGGLAEYWHDVEDVTVPNQDQAHSVLAYLGKKATGEVVVEALQ